MIKGYMMAISVLSDRSVKCIFPLFGLDHSSRTACCFPSSFSFSFSSTFIFFLFLPRNDDQEEEEEEDESKEGKKTSR